MQQTIAQSWVEEGIKIGEKRAFARDFKIGFERGVKLGLVHVIIRLGTKRLGEPNTDIRDSLTKISDVDSLNVLFDRVQEIAAWDDLLIDTTRQSSAQ